MKGWVVDSSLALAFGLPDESSTTAASFFGRIMSANEVWVPALWWYEVSNGLLVAERRNRITEAEALRIVEMCRRLPLETDFHSGPEVLGVYRALAREHGLSAYDAAYLELAERREFGLASLDGPLVKAARKAGVLVFEV